MKSFVLLLICFFCTTVFSNAARRITTRPDSSKTFLALGDSYTIGESVTAAERFPAQTAGLLNEKGIKTNTIQYIARTGWTTADLQEAISQSKLKPSYDIVTLLIGVNDQFQGLDTSGYQTRFTQLLQTAIELSGNKKQHVFVLSIPDYGVTPFGRGSVQISKEIDVFNSINKRISLQYGVAYIDITPASRKVPADPSLTANDGLHPSAKQYQLWSALLAEKILSR